MPYAEIGKVLIDALLYLLVTIGGAWLIETIIASENNSSIDEEYLLITAHILGLMLFIFSRMGWFPI